MRNVLVGEKNKKIIRRPREKTNISYSFRVTDTTRKNVDIVVVDDADIARYESDFELSVQSGRN